MTIFTEVTAARVAAIWKMTEMHRDRMGINTPFMRVGIVLPQVGNTWIGRDISPLWQGSILQLLDGRRDMLYSLLKFRA